jgi:hypothetical protein
MKALAEAKSANNAENTARKVILKRILGFRTQWRGQSVLASALCQPSFQNRFLHNL